MYARNFSHNFVVTGSPNLKCLVPERCCENVISNYGFIMRRQFSECRNYKDLKSKLETIFGKAKLYRRLLFSRQSPEKTLKVWAQQFEFVFAQRVRRGQQMFSLYSKWWEEKAFKELLKRLRVGFSRNGREFIMGTMGVSVYNWKEKRIPDEELNSHLDDLSYVQVLKDATMCLSCAEGVKSNKNSTLCPCGTDGVTTKTYDNWVPFIEKDDLIVWRRSHGEDGLFEYKVYGSYYDVTAEDFLNVQVDTEYRKQWDTTAIQLEIGEQDPDPDGNSDILYWEMQWPRFFVNRDYVFNRRYKVFDDPETMIIMNKTTDYPRFPKYPDKFRIEDYWSCMVIKPYKQGNEPGIEFCLTYFDNPGVNIPSSVTTWVAKSAMPDYLAKLRYASRKYKDYCIKSGTSKACQKYIDEEKARRKHEEENKFEYCSNERLTVMLTDIYEDIHRKANEKFFRKSIASSGSLEKSEVSPSSGDVQQSQPASINPKQKDNTFWKYLHPTYYFT